jgi:hypothetical protein
MRDAIVSLHEMVGNAETSGYTIVLATGGTQTIAAASYAIAMAQKQTMNIFAKVPHYNGYQSWANCKFSFFLIFPGKNGRLIGRVI